LTTKLSAREVVEKLVDSRDKVSILKQVEFLGISRSSVYYQPVPVDQKTLELLNQADEIHTKYPYYGSRKIAVELTKLRREEINRKRAQRLMRILGIQAIYPKPNLSKNNKAHPVYPYLLKNLNITHPNHVWGSDITYIRMNHGFVYLVAILDWFSRFIVAWQISITLEKDFVIETAQRGLKTAIPEISNVDQGSQFTNQDFLDVYEVVGTKISMDSKGRYLDNILTERLWRTIKYEEVYLKNYELVTQAEQNIGEYIHSYNYDRPHQSLSYKTPAEIYFKS